MYNDSNKLDREKLDKNILQSDKFKLDWKSGRKIILNGSTINIIDGIGKRKAAVASVKLFQIQENVQSQPPGILINGKPPEIYLQFNLSYINTMLLPLEILNLSTNTINIQINVKGGGLSGQTDAIKLGLSRALCKLHPLNRSLLKPYGFLTRDSRIKESKKYGLKKARKASQYSKR
jgi:small subunit ribosomal protein S9